LFRQQTKKILLFKILFIGEMLMQEKLLGIYDKLLKYFGPRHWWPAETPYEVMVGAVLTQAVAWRNVEKAITNLKNRGLLNPYQLYRADTETLEELLKPTRYYKMKTKKLQALNRFLVEYYQGIPELMFNEELLQLRAKLLKIYGMGPETVDAILLYAGNLPIFVIDAYTKRIFNRLGMVAEKINYSELQAFFMNNLPCNSALYNEYHAQIDALGNRICHNVPKCGQCPLVAECGYLLKVMSSEFWEQPSRLRV
jgi:endonuclease-3 related protein